MSFEIAVAEELALAPARRGLRCRLTSPSDAFTYWSTARARQHHLRGGTGPVPDLASLRLRLRPEARAADLREAAKLEQQVAQAHLQAVPTVGPADLDPEHVDDAAVTAELRSRALFGRGGKLRGRREASRQAASGIADALDERRQQVVSAHDADRTEAARQYAALVAGEPEAVLGALEAAFDHDDVPAVPVASSDGTVTLVLCAPSPEAAPDRRVAEGRRGKPALTDRNESERVGLAQRVMASHCLGAVRRVAALAPGAGSVRVLAVRPVPDRREAEAVFAGHFEVTDAARWADPDLDVVAELRSIDGSLFGGEGRALDLSDEPDIDRVVKEVRAALYP